MALGENPKKIASDVSDGLLTFNSGSLRRFEGGDLKIIMDNLNGMISTLRMDTLQMDDPQYAEKSQEKNRKMGRLRNAMTVIRAYAHKRGIKNL